MSLKRKAQTALDQDEGVRHRSVKFCICRVVAQINNLFLKIWTFLPLDTLKSFKTVDKRSRSLFDKIYPRMTVFSNCGEFWNARVRRNYYHPAVRELWSKKIERICIGFVPSLEIIKIADDEFRLPLAICDMSTALKYIEFRFEKDHVITAKVDIKVF